MIEVDNIIKLDNNKEYLLLDKTQIDDKEFFFAVSVDENEEPDLDDNKILEASKENGKEYVKEVTDEQLKTVLFSLFVANYAEMANETLKNGN